MELYNLQSVPFTNRAAPSLEVHLSKVQLMILVLLPITYNAPALFVELQLVKLISLIIASLPVTNNAPPSTLDESLPSSIYAEHKSKVDLDTEVLLPVRHIAPPLELEVSVSFLSLLIPLLLVQVILYIVP